MKKKETFPLREARGNTYPESSNRTDGEGKEDHFPPPPRPLPRGTARPKVSRGSSGKLQSFFPDHGRLSIYFAGDFTARKFRRAAKRKRIVPWSRVKSINRWCTRLVSVLGHALRTGT